MLGDLLTGQVTLWTGSRGNKGYKQFMISKFRVTYSFICQQMGVICKRARRAPAAGPQINKDYIEE